MRKELLEMLAGECGKSFMTSSRWVKENDREIYDYLHGLVIEFVEDESNAIDENDLIAFENGTWIVEYCFRKHSEGIELLVTAGRNGHHVAIQSAWMQETYSVEDLGFLNWKAYLKRLC